MERREGRNYNIVEHTGSQMFYKQQNASGRLQHEHKLQFFTVGTILAPCSGSSDTRRLPSSTVQAVLLLPMGPRVQIWGGRGTEGLY